MRFRRHADEGQPADTRPEAVFAGVLDGRRLWVAVPARSGRLALRDPASGDVVEPPDDGGPGDDQPGYLSARLVLDGLGELDEATHEVVVLPGDGGAPLPVRTPPLPARPVPAAPGGASRLVVLRGDDDTLRVRREPLAPAATAERFRVDGAAVVVTMAGSGGTALRLVDDDDVELGAWPLAADRTATVSVDGLGSADPQLARVLLDDRPVRRRAHDLPDPGRAAPLPQVGRLRLRWSGRGLLQARLLDHDEAGE